MSQVCGLQLYICIPFQNCNLHSKPLCCQLFQGRFLRWHNASGRRCLLSLPLRSIDLHNSGVLRAPREQRSLPKAGHFAPVQPGFQWQVARIHASTICSKAWGKSRVWCEFVKVFLLPRIVDLRSCSVGLPIAGASFPAKSPFSLVTLPTILKQEKKSWKGIVLKYIEYLKKTIFRTEFLCLLWSLVAEQLSLTNLLIAIGLWGRNKEKHILDDVTTRMNNNNNNNNNNTTTTTTTRTRTRMTYPGCLLGLRWCSLRKDMTHTPKQPNHLYNLYWLYELPWH